MFTDSSFSKLDYFDRDSVMYFVIVTSCRANEVSQDAGEGKGSAWTNHFIAKGELEPKSGHRFTCKDAKGQYQHQTTQKHNMKVYAKYNGWVW